MIDREQLAAIAMACLLAIFIAICLLLQTGCMSSRGVDEMSVSVPALFQFDMEFHEEEPTSLSIGPSTWWEALLQAPESVVVPAEE